MLSRSVTLTALLLALTVLLAPGCRKSGGTLQSPTSAPPPAVVEPEIGDKGADSGDVKELGSESFAEPGLVAEEVAEEPVVTVEEEIAEGQRTLRAVYFAFDSYELSDDALSAIQAAATWLNAHTAVRATVAGHCDERGTIEYNIDLGAKRARAVRDHLLRLGVAADRVATISYGEERPAEHGNTESAWAKNRRAEFMLDKR